MITILRLGHRPGRDDRNSTHCGLVARALGADEIIYSGEEDSNMIENIKETAQRWGGKFSVSYEKSPRKVIEKYKKKRFLVVHLTVYGEPIQNTISRIRRFKKILVIIGGQKVPGEIYKLSDLNIGVTQQPHSEVAALSIFLHEYFRGDELNKAFRGAKIKVIPSKCGKIVKELK